MQLIEVSWTDSCIESGPIPAEIAAQGDGLTRQDVGYLISEDELTVRMAMGHYEDDGKTWMTQVAKIPRRMILRIERLTYW